MRCLHNSLDQYADRIAYDHCNGWNIHIDTFPLPITINSIVRIFGKLVTIYQSFEKNVKFCPRICLNLAEPSNFQNFSSSCDTYSKNSIFSKTKRNFLSSIQTRIMKFYSNFEHIDSLYISKYPIPIESFGKNFANKLKKAMQRYDSY